MQLQSLAGYGVAILLCVTAWGGTHRLVLLFRVEKDTTCSDILKLQPWPFSQHMLGADEPS